MRRFSRRDLLRGAGALAASGLVVPARARRAAFERKFLFVVARGGWDTTYVFTPSFSNGNVDVESDAWESEANGIPYTDSDARLSVRAFFEEYGDRAAVINGMEVRSVTHERCERILLTGSSSSGADDWASILAGRATSDLLLPHLVVYGTAITRQYTSSVVRVGNNGQLPGLLSGEALTQSGLSLAAFTPDVDALADAYLRDRVAAREAAVASALGRGPRFTNGYGRALDTLEEVYTLSDSLSLAPEDAGCARDLAEDAAVAFECMELGLTRCAMIQYDGWCSEGWDTHATNRKQGVHFELLFGYLRDLMADLDTRTSPTGGALADEVTVVVLSEMGRHPQLNSGEGKDHWTFTSAMLVGSGIRGGTVVGEMDDDFQGRPIDLESGEATESGERVLPAHLGATLLALGDIDPAEHVTGGEQPIAAVMA